MQPRRRTRTPPGQLNPDYPWGSAGLPCGTWGSNTTATENPALYGANGMGTPEGGRQLLGNRSWNPKDSLPPRSTVNTNEVWQFDVGLDFDIGQEWTGEFYVSHGESATYNVAYGNLSLERYRQLLNRPTMAAAHRSPATSRPTPHARSSGPPTSRVRRASTTRISAATSRSRRTVTTRSTRRSRRARRTSRTSSS